MIHRQEKLNEAVMVLNKNLQVRSLSFPAMKCCSDKVRGIQEINIQNMNVELVAQMFKNYQSNVLFHLEGMSSNLHVEFMRHYAERYSNG